MKDSNFVLDGVEVLNYKFQKKNLNRSGGSYGDTINLNRGEFYIYSPKWIKNKQSCNKSKQ